MSVLSKSSGRVLPPHPRTCRLLSMLKNKAELVSVAMLSKIYGLCQVTFFSFSLRLILKQLNLKPLPFSPLSLSKPRIDGFCQIRSFLEVLDLLKDLLCSI